MRKAVLWTGSFATKCGSVNNTLPRFQGTLAMAAFDTSRPTYAANHKGFGAFATSLISAFAAWNDARVTRNALKRLSDHELDDIGLTRSDIDFI